MEDGRGKKENIRRMHNKKEDALGHILFLYCQF